MSEPDVSTSGPMVKRTLVTLSHAIEAAGLAQADDGPVVVVALFQRLPYFDRERDMYSRLAERPDAAVVVGFVDDFRPQLSGRVHPVLLDLAEPLAQEWTVVVATPQMGAFLVAEDEETVAPGERSLEAGRLFRSRWGFTVAGGHDELRRLRTALATRIPPGALAVVDTVLAGPRHARRTTVEDRADASLRVLVAEMERARRRGVALQEQLDAVTLNGDRDLASQLYTPGYLQRWVGSNRTTTAGPLPLALVQLTVPDLAGVGRQYGTRTERELAAQVAGPLTWHLRPIDRAVRLGEGEFLLVLPGVGEDDAAVLARQVAADIAGLSQVYPFLPMGSVGAVTVTRQRPLPLAELGDAVRWAASQEVPLALLPA